MGYISRLLFCLALLLCSFGLFACQLTASWEPWEPYQFKDSQGQTAGLDIELIGAVAGQLGCQVEYVQRPWSRTLQEIKTGSVNLSAGASINEERKAYAHFSLPVREEKVVLLVRKGEVANYRLNSLADVVAQRIRLGVTRGYYHGPDYQKLMQDPAFSALVQEANGATQNLQKLDGGRVDGVLIDIAVGRQTARELGMEDKFEPHPLKVLQEDVYFILSKASVDEEMVARINQALEILRDNGQHQAILAKYGL